MNIFQSEQLRKNFMTLSEKHLYDLRNWYADKEKYKHELLLIDLEIERRAKIKKRYEN